ncbi:MAG: DNA primase [Patescibacteria group bacterium]
MTSRSTEEIKTRLSIVDLIQGYVRLEKSGINFRGRCPFHQERTPSFFVSPARQTWRCFGCQKGGDHFSFIEEIEGVEFPEALKMLAERTGVVITREDPRAISERARLLAICEDAAKFFELQLHASENPNRMNPVLRYLVSRGLIESTIKDFRLGYAPDSWDALYVCLTRKGYKESEIENAGLIIKKEQARSEERKYYDRYRNRIIFPITDASGRIIAFGGRIFPTQKLDEEKEAHSSRGALEGAAKYINSPETPLYNKSRVLYGFHRSKNTIREKNECVVVEGYMDAIMAHQAGVANTVAVSGTALTNDQLRILARLANSIIFAFDMDSAGQSATKRSLDLSSEFNISRKVLILPSGKDPADAVREDKNIFIMAVASSVPIMEYYFGEAGKQFDVQSPQGKKNSALFFLPHVKNLTNEIERAHWIQKFSDLISIPEIAIRAELDKMRGVRAEKFVLAPTNAHNRSRRELLEERLLCLYVHDPGKFEEVEKKFPEALPFVSLAHERFFAELQEKKSIQTAESKNFFEKLKFEAETMNYNALDVSEELLFVALGILAEYYKEQMSNLNVQIKSLEKSPNQDRMNGLLKNFNEVADKVKRYSA